jgi:hypothetical protein
MKFIRILMICLGMFLCFNYQVFAIDCSELDTNEKIKVFVKNSKESNPLMRKKLSAKMKISKVEGKACRSKPSKNWIKKVSTVHSLRMDKNSRTFFIKGKDAPICLVKKDKAEFKCSECTSDNNDQCRSHKSSKSTAIRDTNIDTADLEVLDDDFHTNVCKNFQKKYMKITATKIGGDSPYEKVISFYEQKRGVLLKVNLFYQGTLAKVYRLSPKKYVKIDGEWLSTSTRVRTVCGSEKKYSYETKVEVQKKANKKHDLYTDPSKDPYLKNTSFNVLFSIAN